MIFFFSPFSVFSLLFSSNFLSPLLSDGVIEAKIDHENGWLSSHEVLDLYSTDEPQKNFHKYVLFPFFVFVHDVIYLFLFLQAYCILFRCSQ
jgi:hypothetical protein